MTMFSHSFFTVVCVGAWMSTFLLSSGQAISDKEFREQQKQFLKDREMEIKNNGTGDDSIYQRNRIIKDGVKVKPYLGPYVEGQQERDALKVRDDHQALLIALIVLGSILGLSCIPTCAVLWCCIYTGRRIRKIKIENYQDEIMLAPTFAS